MIAFLNESGARWMEILAWATLQNTVFLALVFLLLRLMRDASARVKHSLALLGLLKLLLPPFLPLTLVEGGTGFLAAPAAEPSEALFWIPGGQALSAGMSLNAEGAALALWILGAALALILPLLSSLRLWRLLRRARPVEADAMALAPGIRVLLSEELAGPMTFGPFSRRIYVPAAWQGWDPERRALVLRHEEAHIRRGDGLVLMLQSLARALHFFNPLAHLLCRRLQEYREMACDDRSVEAARQSPVNYSRHLVGIAEDALGAGRGWESASALLRRRKELTRRVEYQMKGGSMASRFRKPSPWMIVALALLALPLSWYPGEAGEVEMKEKQVELEAGNQDVKPPKGVHVTLRANGDMEMNGRSTDLMRMSKIFTGFGEADPEKVVVDLYCEDEVSMERLQGFHELLQEKSIHRVRYLDKKGKPLPLALPSEGMLRKLDSLPEKQVIQLNMEGPSTLVLDGRKLKHSKLAGMLAKRLLSDPNSVLALKPDPAASYSTLIAVLEAAQKAGIQKIALLPPDA